MWILAALLACVELPIAPDCAATSPMVGEAQADWLASGELSITGTVSHPDGLAIRTVHVGAHTANNLGFNFDDWSLILSEEQALDAVDADLFTADIQATDACEQTSLLQSLAVPLPQEPASLSRLAIDLILPSGHTYMPADGSVSAAIDVRANPEATGLELHLSSSTGLLSAETSTFELGPDGDAHWIGTWTANQSGSVVITVTAGAELRTQTLIAEGSPLFLPSQAEIGPGAALVLQVDPQQGELSTCSAVGELGATSGTVDLRNESGGVDTNGDGLFDLFITAPLDSISGQETRITCEDVYGQAATAVVTRR